MRNVRLALCLALSVANMRLAFVYGYGSLDRFGAVGQTHFLQTRLQFTL